MANLTLTYSIGDDATADDCISTLARALGWPNAKASEEETQLEFIARIDRAQKGQLIRNQKASEATAAVNAQLDPILGGITVTAEKT